MNLRFILYSFLLTLCTKTLKAQEISSLNFLDKIVVANDLMFEHTRVGGLSAITFNPDNDAYYLVADKPPSRTYKVNLVFKDSLQFSIDSVFKLTPPLISKSELEGIVYNKNTKGFIVADEQSEGTRIMAVDRAFNFMRIMQPLNESFLPLSGHNSGIEGLTIDDQVKYLYYAFERPSEKFLSEQLVKITKSDISDMKKETVFYYKLHKSIADRVGTNGISEILYINHNTLLVMERAYIPGLGNIVRLYTALLPEGTNRQDDENNVILKSELLFDFGSVDGFQIDNAEGMTFNKDRSLLFIVTDNNFSKRQKTQIIVLAVSWE